MSKSIGLFYGTTTGKTESVAEIVRDEFGGDTVTLHEIGSADNDDFAEYECLIIACPTWNIGELQSDWEGFFPELDNIDFSGKKVAYLGTGDQEGYPDNFMDAMGILKEEGRKKKEEVENCQFPIPHSPFPTLNYQLSTINYAVN